jgi:hypothetical protein
VIWLLHQISLVERGTLDGAIEYCADAKESRALEATAVAVKVFMFII